MMHLMMRFWNIWRESEMLKIAHVHGYPVEYLGLFAKLKDGGTIRQFINEVESLANKLKLDEDDKFEFKGDCLEVLCEIFFKLNSTSPRFGLRDYIPNTKDNDYGVDGTGYNANGDKCAVQVKYKQNPAEQILFADIAKTYMSGAEQNEIDVKKDKIIYIFTTSNIESNPLQLFKDKYVFISRKMIASEIDNNVNFWQVAYLEVYNSLN